METETVQTPVSVETPAPATEPEAPVAEPPSDAPVSEGAAPEGEAPAEVTEPEAPWTYESVAENPHFKEWHEDDRATAKREGRIEAVQAHETYVQQAEDRRDQVLQGISDLNTTLRELSDSGRGLDATTFGRLLQRHAGGLNLIPQILSEANMQPVADQASAFTMAQSMYVLGQAMESEDLMNMATRVASPTNQRDGSGNPVWVPTPEYRDDRGESALKDFAKKLKKSITDAAEERGYKRGKAEGQGISAEASKAASRDGKGPATVTGTAGKGSSNEQQRLDRLAYGRDSDGNTATDEDRAWLAARQ